MESLDKQDIKDLILSPYGYVASILFGGYLVARKFQPFFENLLDVNFSEETKEILDLQSGKKDDIKDRIAGDITLRTTEAPQLTKIEISSRFEPKIIDSMFINIKSFEDWIREKKGVFIVGRSVDRLIKLWQSHVKRIKTAFELEGKRNGFLTGTEINILFRELEKKRAALTESKTQQVETVTPRRVSTVIRE